MHRLFIAHGNPFQKKAPAVMVADVYASGKAVPKDQVIAQNTGETVWFVQLLFQL